MLPLVTNAPMDSASGATRTPATAPAQPSLGLAQVDAPSTIKTQTEVAVVASALVRQASGDAAPPPKQPVRLPGSVNASQVAAQWLAQQPQDMPTVLQLFQPLPSPALLADAAEDGTLYAMVKPNAREDKPTAEKTAASTPSEVAAERILATDAAQRLMQPIRQQASAVLRDVPVQASVIGLPVRMSAGGKREHLTQGRGVDAYGMASARAGEESPSARMVV